MAGRNISYWIATAESDAFPSLAGNLDVDVAIIGGGIVGITAARLLKDEGRTVAVLEALRVGQEVTGKSTAKITSQHNLIYGRLTDRFGEDAARAYAEANEAGVRMILDLAAEHGIDCHLEAKSAFVYARDPGSVASIEREVEAARHLGLPASLTRDTTLPFPVAAAARFDGQAQFHPVKYVAGLARTIPGDGSHVFENSRVVDWAPNRVATAGGSVSARCVIMASHLPLGQTGLFFAEAYPHMHPVIMGQVDPARVPDGMFISVEEPHHSVRSHTDGEGAAWLIFAGSSFKGGHVDDERRNFADLQRFALENFGVEAEYRWTNIDYRTMDGAPYVGWSSSLSDAYLVATGFNAWGISNGAAAAMVLTDLVAGREARWSAVYDATRVKPIAGGKEFVKGTADVVSHLASGYLSRKPHSFDAVEVGEAAILSIDGEKIAAYRDEQGKLHAVSATCTHMGCILGWNETDRTWDCPCHGSRFDLTGGIVHGPATEPLAIKQAAECEAQPS